MRATHIGAADRMLGYIKRCGTISRRDLREELNLCADDIDSVLAQPLETGVVVQERQPADNSNRLSIHYRWAGTQEAQKKTGPCLGGCGKTIVRDGVVFMCPACRSRGAKASPYAP